MKNGGGRGWHVLVLALCLTSLSGLGPVRTAEQLPAGAARWFEVILSGLIPATDGPGEPVLAAGLGAWPLSSPAVDDENIWFASDEERALARRAWDLYEEAVRGEVGGLRDGRAGLLVSVVASDPAGRRLSLHVPVGAVERGAPVMHRDVLIGFVDTVEESGRAGVRLLGHPSVGAVAGEWQAAPGGRSHHFLARARDGRLVMEHASSTVRPPAEQLLRTRDVSFLGVDLPPGLLIGRVVGNGAEEVPGGGSVFSRGDLKPVIAPLFDPHGLGAVVVEGQAGVRLTTATRVGRLSRSMSAEGRWRVDLGRADGVTAGQWVVQDGVFVGLIETAGGSSSIVRRAQPPGGLLVVEADGQVVPFHPSPLSADRMQAGNWRPEPGLIVCAGHPTLGGLLLGEVPAVFSVTVDGGWDLVRPDVDPERPVTVVDP